MDIFLFVFSCVFREFRVMYAHIKKSPVHETEVQSKKVNIGIMKRGIFYRTYDRTNSNRYSYS